MIRSSQSSAAISRYLDDPDLDLQMNAGLFAKQMQFEILSAKTRAGSADV